MYSYPQALVRSLFATLGGLPLGCAFVAFCAGAFLQLDSPDRFTSLSPGWAGGVVISAFAIIYGLLPAFLFGTPLYAFLLKTNRANIFTASVIGVLPGSVLLALDTDLAIFVLAYGLPVAACTHLLAVKLAKRDRLNAP